MSDQPELEPDVKNDEAKGFKIWVKNTTKAILASLRRIFTHIGGISLRHFRSPGTIFWSIVYPIVLVLIFGAIFGRSSFQTLNLNVADLDQSDASEHFIDQLQNISSLRLDLVEEYIISPDSWLKENNEYVLLVIPETWGVKVSLNTTANLTIYFDPASHSAGTIIEIVEEAINEFNLELLPIEVNFGLEVEYDYIEDLTYIDSLIPGIIMITISTLSLFTGVNYDLEEKRRGIIYRLAATPGRRFEWILSKQIWQMILTIIASTLVILVSLIFGFSGTGLHPLMLVLVIFASLTFTGIAMILVRLMPNSESVIFTSLLIAIPQIVLSGALIRLSEFPLFLRYVSRVFPLFYLTEGMRYLMMNVLNEQFWIFFAISGAMAIAFFGLGVFATKWRKE